MTYTGVVISPKSGLKKIVLTQELILVSNLVSQNYGTNHFFPLLIYFHEISSYYFFMQGNKLDIR